MTGLAVQSAAGAQRHTTPQGQKSCDARQSEADRDRAVLKRSRPVPPREPADAEADQTNADPERAQQQVTDCVPSCHPAYLRVLRLRDYRDQGARSTATLHPLGHATASLRIGRRVPVVGEHVDLVRSGAERRARF